jgi:hypothetical protein
MSKWWIGAGISFAAAVAAIFVNTSRGGLGLFLVGMSLWLVTSAMRKTKLKQAALWVSLVTIVGSLLLVSQGNLSQRLRSGFDWNNLSADFRVVLLRDSMDMFASAPLAGLGLGNFSYVYPQVTTLNQSTLRFLHPESDLLWLLTEGGLILSVPCLVLVIGMISLSGPWRTTAKSRGRADRHLCRGAGIAALLGLLHSIVDVPLHGMAYFMTAALLAGLAMNPERLGPKAGWRYASAFRLIGLVIVGVGACFICVAFGRLELPLPSAVPQILQRAASKSEARDPAGALTAVERAIKIMPLDYRLAYLRAQLRLQNGQSSALALHDFGLARAL